MEGSYSQGGNANPAPPHMMGGYYQGMPNNYNMPPAPVPSSSPNSNRSSNTISIWAGDLDAYMDETFLRQAVTASGWGSDITRIKVVRDHYSGAHAGYGFLDAASPDAAQRVIATGSGMPIPGTNRCWRLNMGRNAQAMSNAGTEINIYVGNLEPSVTDYQLMTAFRPRYASVRHAKVVCNEFGQSRGFGFVRFANPQDAERAVSEMQNFEFNNKPIRLSPANGRARSGRSSHHGGPSPGPNNYNNHHHGHHSHGHGTSTNKRPRQHISPDDPNNTTIFIGGTGSHITDDLLWREFSTFGDLDGVRVPVNKTGFAFVRFKNRECAQRAKDELSGSHYPPLNPHKPVRIEWAAEQIPVSRPPQNSMSMNYGAAAAQAYDPQYSSQYAAGANDMDQGYDNYATNGSVAANPSSGASNLASTSNSSGANDNKAVDGKVVDSSANATSADTGAVVQADGMAGVSSNGETEPPSKRAAVGRPEYASDTAAKKDVENKPEGATEDSPAMHFSWLNPTSSQPAVNQ